MHMLTYAQACTCKHVQLYCKSSRTHLFVDVPRDTVNQLNEQQGDVNKHESCTRKDEGGREGGVGAVKILLEQQRLQYMTRRPNTCICVFSVD